MKHASKTKLMMLLSNKMARAPRRRKRRTRIHSRPGPELQCDRNGATIDQNKSYYELTVLSTVLHTPSFKYNKNNASQPQNHEIDDCNLKK
mmetsp:Transcript_78144/g.216918  ORF Transcript_78144/g.216918 Transcript_78144/m.216918 type:complete len:91 (-) Transcript_78144:767-1039(-)